MGVAEYSHPFALFCCNPELRKASVNKPLNVSVLCGAIETTATHP